MFFYVTLHSALKPPLNDTRPTLFSLKETKRKTHVKNWALTHCGDQPFAECGLQYCISSETSRICFFPIFFRQAYILFLTDIFLRKMWTLLFLGERKNCQKTRMNSCFRLPGGRFVLVWAAAMPSMNFLSSTSSFCFLPLEDRGWWPPGHGPRRLQFSGGTNRQRQAETKCCKWHFFSKIFAPEKNSPFQLLTLRLKALMEFILFFLFSRSWGKGGDGRERT